MWGRLARGLSGFFLFFHHLVGDVAKRDANFTPVQPPVVHVVQRRLRVLVRRKLDEREALGHLGHATLHQMDTHDGAKLGKDLGQVVGVHVACEVLDADGRALG